MSTPDFGSGIRLSDNFDFVINQGGDIDTVSGTDELQKDLAFRVADRVNDDIGRQLTRENREDIALQISQAIKSDPRIDEVTSLGVRENSNNRYEIIAEVDATTADGPFSLVIPVNG